ncbi:hypothetical protein BZA77DRAFT_301643 [Pyronema omphalodes]|nr:hypothetical protein BZA77DRAFT_301643 [Pyronema omphalodes]
MNGEKPGGISCPHVASGLGFPGGFLNSGGDYFVFCCSCFFFYYHHFRSFFSFLFAPSSSSSYYVISSVLIGSCFLLYFTYFILHSEALAIALAIAGILSWSVLIVFLGLFSVAVCSGFCLLLFFFCFALLCFGKGLASFL